MTFGEKAVASHPVYGAELDAVEACKAEYAKVLDRMDELRAIDAFDSHREIARMASIAITYAQTAQMWAVKALTWKD